MHDGIDWKSRIRSAFGKDQPAPEDDVLEELAAHAESMYEAARVRGRSHEEALEAVRLEMESWKVRAAELRRPMRRPPSLPPPPAFSSSRFAGLGHDISYGLRLLLRQPRYSLLVLFLMALGIGATTTVFSVTHGVLMKALPWPNGARLVVIKETRGGRPPRFGGMTNAVYLAWRSQMTTVEDIAGWSQRDVTLSRNGTPERIRVVFATASLFPVLGVQPLLGASFTPAEEAGHVLLLSESLWRERFGGAPDVLGTIVDLDGEAYTVIGVLRDSQAYPDRQARAWAPMRVAPVTGNALSLFNAVATLRAGTTAAAAAAEGTARAAFAPDTGMTTQAIFGASGAIEVSAQPLTEAMTADVRTPLLVLLAAVGLLFATAIANAAALQLARATTRRRELGIRAALGANGGRVARQLVIENLLLGLGGGAGGLALAWWLHGVLPALLPADFPRMDALEIDLTVMAFALASSVSASVICGLAPAVYVLRAGLVQSLSENTAAAVGLRRRSVTQRTRVAVMAGQVATACMLLVAASLLGRSFLALVHADRGYDPAGVQMARLSMPNALYTAERRYEIVDGILRRLIQNAAFDDVAFTSELPLTPGGSTAALTLRAADGSVNTVQASPRLVSAGYFRAMRMRIVEGRGFDDSDDASAPPVAVVNQAFARRYLNGPAVGVPVPMGVGYGDVTKTATIVGVLDDVRYVSSSEPTHPEIYYSYRQLAGRLAPSVVTLVARGPGDATQVVPELRSAITEADARLAPDAVFTLEGRLMQALARTRLYTILITGFGGLALLVAMAGLCGVLSYAVAQRSREIALRTALGARRRDVITEVLRQGLAITAAGAAAGLLLSAAVMHFIGSMLTGMTTHDPVTYVLVPVVLLVATVVACLAPALRAARIDPIRLLKS